jgi:hypothetical protein
MLGILGVSGVSIATTLTSCSEKPNLILNNETELNQYIDSHHDQIQDVKSFTSGTTDSIELKSYFLNGGKFDKLTPQNVLSSMLLNIFDDLMHTAITPLKLKTEINEHLVSIKLTSDFEYAAGEVGSDILCKGTFFKFECSSSQFSLLEKTQIKYGIYKTIYEHEGKIPFNDLIMGIDTRSNDPYLQFYEADSSLLGLSLPQS